MKTRNRNRGQVMILSVLLISSVILSASALASTLILFQLKRVGGAEESAQAVFAADAGLERALYERFKPVVPGGCVPQSISSELTDFSENSSYQVVITGDVSGCKEASSLGKSGRSARAFKIIFDGLCGFGNQTDGC